MKTMLERILVPLDGSLRAELILDQSRSLGADLIVMATRGHSGVTRWLLGSVAERVVRHAVTPTLVVPARASSKGKK
jgi:nucleotide-binding universal stress UspA family protein